MLTAGNTNSYIEIRSFKKPLGRSDYLFEWSYDELPKKKTIDYQAFNNEECTPSNL